MKGCMAFCGSLGAIPRLKATQMAGEMKIALVFFFEALLPSSSLWNFLFSCPRLIITCMPFEWLKPGQVHLGV